MNNKIDQIKKQFNGFKDKILLFFCISNIFKGDDALGNYMFEKLREGRYLKKINAENSPSHNAGKINRISHDIVIIIDCVNDGKNPGDIILRSFGHVHNSPMDTHSGLLPQIVRSFKNKKNWYILGIQPCSLKGFQSISPVVKRTADKLLQYINKEFGG